MAKRQHDNLDTLTFDDKDSFGLSVFPKKPTARAACKDEKRDM